MRGRFKILSKSLAVLIIHGLVFCIVTWPFALSPLTHIIGWPGDNLQHLWSLWWAKYAWLDLHQPLNQISVFYYPVGMNNPMVGATVWNQFVWLPVVLVFNPIVAYNVALVAAYVLTGLATYWLIVYITHSHPGALVGSLIFNFCAARMSHIYAHLPYLTIYLHVLYVLALLWFGRRPNWRRAFVLFIISSMAALVNFKLIIVFMLPISLVIVLYHLINGSDLKYRLTYSFYILISATFSSVLWSFFGLPLINSAINNQDYLLEFGAESNSASLLGFFVPSWRNPLLPDISEFKDFIKKVNGFWIECLVYIGFPAMFLAFSGVRGARRSVTHWLVLVIVCAILAMGPFLKLAGETITLQIEGLQYKAVMPWAYLSQLPFLGLLRTPSRFALAMMIGISILSGFGVSFILKSISNKLLRLVLPGMLGIMAVWEGVVVFPTRLFEPTAPAFFHHVAKEDKSAALLTLPASDPKNPSNLAWAGVELQMYHQTVHERPMTSGFIWRASSAAAGVVHQIQHIIAPDLFVDIINLNSDMIELLNSLSYSYVVVYKDNARGARVTGLSLQDLTRVRERLSKTLGAPIFEDAQILVFQVPDVKPRVPFVATYDGWYPVEYIHSDTPTRWSSSQASLFLYAPISQTVKLEVRYKPLMLTQTLELFGQDRQIPLNIVSHDDFITAISGPIEIGPHYNFIKILSRESCVEIDPFYFRRRRCVAFLFKEIKVIYERY